VETYPDVWRLAWRFAAAQGDPFLAALTELADRDPSPLPLDEFGAMIPLGHAQTPWFGVDRRPARLTARPRRHRQHRPDTTTQAQRAAALNNLAVRQAEVGDRQTALATITEAVEIRRQLAHANPAAFLPNLAGSLNNLANQAG